ncbi:MAG TPA: stage V sporulation protein AD [Candidatus Enterenecus merdae]|nr:stage V sporulation protein AD [Candidatus Enterenecus merdae]
MGNTKLGSQSFCPDSPPVIVGYGCAAGGKEAEGPLGARFDHISQDDTFGESSWEKAESRMQDLALKAALGRAGLASDGLDLLLAGDLLNQCIGSSFAARTAAVPYLGLYGACSTMGESLALASLLLGAGYGRHAAAVTSSHFCSAERQYRTPLEYGCQRTPTAQWTATASGAVVLGREGHGPRVTCVTIGIVRDKGIQDANNMGAAMAPAAYDTLRAHFADTGRSPDYYDLIVTGDLGYLGHRIVTDFFARDGVRMDHYDDCGLILFDRERQDVHCGASGCGCSASVLTAHLLPGMEKGLWRRILFCPTGALLSPTSTMQGESIPGICHAVALEGGS